MRSAELARLDWSEVNLQERHITVAADKAKTGARRVVPISDNLSAWLQQYARPHGEVMSYVNWWNGNAGSGPGVKVSVTAALNPTGKFEFA